MLCICADEKSIRISSKTHLLNIDGEAGVENIKPALRALDKDFPVLWVVIDAETVEA